MDLLVHRNFAQQTHALHDMINKQISLESILPTVQYANDGSVNRSIGMNPFEVVYKPKTNRPSNDLSTDQQTF